MAVKYPRMRDGLYMGNFTDEQANAILHTIAQPCIPVFKYKLFDFPKELILRSMDEGKSIRQIIHEEGIDYRQYQGELSDQQTVGAAFMYLSPRSILGDGVGSGKTAQIAAVINCLKQTGVLTRFVMCVESTAVGQALYEMIRFTGLRVIEMPTTAAEMRKTIGSTSWSSVDGIVMGHSGLRSDVFSQWVARYLDEYGMSRIFNTFVLDESSVIKSQGTKIYDYTYNLCRVIPRVHLLNATAFETCILDVYNQIDMMDSTVLPKRWRIEKEYCTYRSVSFWKTDKVTRKPQQQFRYERSGYKNQQAFRKALQLFYFGRPRAESKHKYRVVTVAPTPQQMLWIKRKYRYSEVLNCPSAIPEMMVPTNCESTPKLRKLVDMLSQEYAGKQVMVYCFHIGAQEAMADACRYCGRRPVVLNGSTPMKDRYDIQSRFNSGEYDTIITNIQKSLNLAGGDVCIIYSQIGNPARMEQVRGRIDRNVDEQQREFVLMLYEGTAEYEFFLEKAAQRAKDARQLTIDAKTAVDYFMDSLQEEE